MQILRVWTNLRDEEQKFEDWAAEKKSEGFSILGRVAVFAWDLIIRISSVPRTWSASVFQE